MLVLLMYNSSVFEKNIKLIKTEDFKMSRKEEAVSEVVATPVSRQKRVSTKINLPEGDSSVGTIVLTIADVDTPLVYEVDFNSIAPQVLFAATLAGIANKFANAYAGAKEAGLIVSAVEKEIAVLATGEFTSRTLREVKIELPDVIAAWMLAGGKDITSASDVALYKASWDSRDEAGKASIASNLQVIVELDKMQAARRLAKKAKGAVESTLEIL